MKVRYGTFIVSLIMVIFTIHNNIFSVSSLGLDENIISSETQDEKEILTDIVSSDLWFSGYMLELDNIQDFEKMKQNLQNCISLLCAYNDDGAEAFLGVREYDADIVDIHKAGTYNIELSFFIDDDEVGDNYELSPDIQQVSIPVCVSRADDFELFHARSTELSHIIYCLKDLNEQSEVYMYNSSQKCSLETLENCQWQICDSDIALIRKYSLAIKRNALPQNTYSYFYVVHEGIKSQYIEIYEENERYSIVSMGGDRDGSDFGNIFQPQISQPAPEIPETAETSPSQSDLSYENYETVTDDYYDYYENDDDYIPDIMQYNIEYENVFNNEYKESAFTQPAETSESQPVTSVTSAENITSIINTSSETTVSTSPAEPAETTDSNIIEYSDNNTDILSGYRVRCMMEQCGGIARFSKNGITISITRGTFAFSDNDVISVSITPDENNSYIISITINGNDAVLENEITLWFPEIMIKNGNKPEIFLNDSKILNPQYDSENHAYKIQTLETGKFTFTDFTETTSENKTFRIIVIVSVVIIITVFIAGYIFRRKKRKS